LKERLQTHEKMNKSLQDKLSKKSRKADQFDQILAKCIQLENFNQ